MPCAAATMSAPVRHRAFFIFRKRNYPPPIDRGPTSLYTITVVIKHLLFKGDVPMPPRAKFTRKQIIDTALNIVRAHGKDALSARSLGKALGTSSAPIFTAFESMEEVQEEVVKAAKALYAGYINKGLEQTPAFKGAGLQYILFAKNEPELFQLLFMSGNGTEDLPHFLPATDENAPVILSVLEKTQGLDDPTARKIYNHMAVYAFGIAVLFAKKACIFTIEEVGDMLSEVFLSLMKQNAKG